MKFNWKIFKPNMNIMVKNKSEKPCLTSFLMLNINLVQFAFKFLLIIHAHLHLQNSIYFNFLHLQRNDLPKTIDLNVHKQRK